MLDSAIDFAVIIDALQLALEHTDAVIAKINANTFKTCDIHHPA